MRSPALPPLPTTPPTRRARRPLAVFAVPLLLLATACAPETEDDAGTDDANGVAQEWEPTQGVTMTVPFAPGGGSDVFGRSMAAGLESVREGLNISVENRPGGSAAIGYSYFFGQEGNPHALLPSETSGVALPVTTETPWTWRDFTPVMNIAEDVNLLVVPQDSPYQSLEDIVAAAQGGAQPTIGMTGATSADAVVVGLMEQAVEGVTFDRVVFNSGAEEVTALLGGDIEMAMLNPSEVIGQIEGGTARAVAVFFDERLEQAPLDTVPTAMEQGVDVVFTQYRGLFLPGGIEEAELAYWESAMQDWTETESYEEYITNNYLVPVQVGHEDFVTFLEGYEEDIRAALEAEQ